MSTLIFLRATSSHDPGRDKQSIVLIIVSKLMKEQNKNRESYGYVTPVDQKVLFDFFTSFPLKFFDDLFLLNSLFFTHFVLRGHP